MDSYYSISETSLGWIGVLVSVIGIKRTTTPKRTKNRAFLDLKIPASTSEVDSSYRGVKSVFSRLQQYSKGTPTYFDDVIDLKGTEFQLKVWNMVKRVPYGETRNYGWIARLIGSPNASMAVGQALKANPLPIVIPCHRIIGKDGAILGYGGSNGSAMKSLLLSIESQG